MRLTNFNADAVAQVVEGLLARVENIESLIAADPAFAQFAAPALAITTGVGVAVRLADDAVDDIKSALTGFSGAPDTSGNSAPWQTATVHVALAANAAKAAPDSVPAAPVPPPAPAPAPAGPKPFSLVS
jgi:hypothetical protein